MGTWIDWAGGQCPISEDEYVEVRYRNGEVSMGYALNFDWDWMEDDSENDIVAYRVLDGANV